MSQICLLKEVSYTETSEVLFGGEFIKFSSLSFAQVQALRAFYKHILSFLFSKDFHTYFDFYIEKERWG